MEEAFLHFIWKFQQFNTRELTTDSGQHLTILQPAVKNKDGGPDFLNSKIRINEIIWNGNIEIHVKAKDWNRHNHQYDQAYENVILHVVGENDARIKRKDNTIIPALVLKNIVDDKLLVNYQKLLEPESEILTSQTLEQIASITVYGMLDKVLAERLEKKSQNKLKEIALADNDWEEISWRMLCRNFGFKVNAHTFFYFLSHTVGHFLLS